MFRQLTDIHVGDGNSKTRELEPSLVLRGWPRRHGNAGPASLKLMVRAPGAWTSRNHGAVIGQYRNETGRSALAVAWSLGRASRIRWTEFGALGRTSRFVRRTIRVTMSAVAGARSRPIRKPRGMCGTRIRGNIEHDSPTTSCGNLPSCT